MPKITLESDITVEQLNAIFETLIDKKGRKTIIEKWPYWCWNCKGKIEEPPKENICPFCGVQIPEP